MRSQYGDGLIRRRLESCPYGHVLCVKNILMVLAIGKHNPTDLGSPIPTAMTRMTVLFIPTEVFLRLLELLLFSKTSPDFFFFSQRLFLLQGRTLLI